MILYVFVIAAEMPPSDKKGENKMKRILVIVMAMALACVCLVGCGSADFEGKWECEEMSLGGMSLKGDFMGVPVAVSMQIELEKDGKGKHLKLDKEYNVTSDAITWSADGSKCKTTIDGYEIELEKDGSKLIGEYTANGQTTKIVLKKVDKFTVFTKADAEKAASDLASKMKS